MSDNWLEDLRKVRDELSLIDGVVTRMSLCHREVGNSVLSDKLVALSSRLIQCECKLRVVENSILDEMVSNAEESSKTMLEAYIAGSRSGKDKQRT